MPFSLKPSMGKVKASSFSLNRFLYDICPNRYNPDENVEKSDYEVKEVKGEDEDG